MCKVAYISSLILTFFETFFMSVFFCHFLGFVQGKFWGFLHNRVTTLVTIGEQKISSKSDFLKEFLPTPATQDQTPSNFDYAGLAVVAVFKTSSKYVGITRSLATRTLGIPKLLKSINKAQPEWNHVIKNTAPEPCLRWFHTESGYGLRTGLWPTAVFTYAPLAVSGWIFSVSNGLRLLKIVLCKSDCWCCRWWCSCCMREDCRWP